MRTQLQLPRLSKSLAVVRDSYFDSADKAAREGKGDIAISIEHLRTMGRYLDQLVDQAIGMELDAGEMEAIAADLDLIGEAAPVPDRRRAGLARAACPVPGTNVVVLPVVSRTHADGGGAA